MLFLGGSRVSAVDLMSQLPIEDSPSRQQQEQQVVERCQVQTGDALLQ